MGLISLRYSCSHQAATSAQGSFILVNTRTLVTYSDEGERGMENRRGKRKGEGKREVGRGKRRGKGAREGEREGNRRARGGLKCIEEGEGKGRVRKGEGD